MNRIIAIIITLCVFFVVNAKKKEAKFGYIFFESEKNWVVEDSLIRVSVLIASDTQSNNGFCASYTSHPCITVKVENLSDEIVYIDLGSSFFLRNKQALMLWDNSQTVVTNGASTGGSVNLGAVTDAMGIGGIVGTLASGVSIGGGNSTSTSTVTQAERVLRLPPFAEQVFTMQLYMPGISGFGWKYSDGIRRYIDAITMYNPNIDVGDAINYTQESTPLKFQLYFKYAASEAFTSTYKISLPFYANLLVGTKEWPGQEKSVKEINNYGYDLDKPYIIVMFKDDN